MNDFFQKMSKSCSVWTVTGCLLPVEFPVSEWMFFRFRLLSLGFGPVISEYVALPTSPVVHQFSQCYL